jgi:hypothetical protein
MSAEFASIGNMSPKIKQLPLRVATRFAAANYLQAHCGWRPWAASHWGNRRDFVDTGLEMNTGM